MWFRSMTPAPDGLPILGRSARSLGVRVPDDVHPDTAGFVSTGTGGMSVSPASMWNLPHHRRPRGAGRGSTGPASDFIFSTETSVLAVQSLTVRLDPERPGKHAYVEPSERVLLAAYEQSLAATRSGWKLVQP